VHVRARIAVLERRTCRVIGSHGRHNVGFRELIEAVRAEHLHLPIVLATGYDKLPADMARGMPRLLKPFMQNELVQIVNKTVGRRDGAD
jgi:hypothetical protein